MADTIKTVKSSGGDYSSLSAWEAGQQKVISAGDREIADCYAFEDTAGVTIDGWTTVATGTILIRAATGNQHNGTAGTGYRLKTGNGVNAITNNEEFVTFDGIAIQPNSATGGAEALRNAPGVSYLNSTVVFVNGLITTTQDWTADSAGRGIITLGGSLKVVNTAIVGKFYWPVITSDYTGPRLWLYNVTIGGGGTVGLVVDSTSFVKNTYIDAATAYSGTLATFTTCQHSTAQSITGSTGSTAYSTANFTNVTSGSEDFHLPSGSALIDAGTDLSGDAGYAFSTDWEGTTRSGTWDIGPDEYVSAATSYPMYAYAQQ